MVYDKNARRRELRISRRSNGTCLSCGRARGNLSKTYCDACFLKRKAFLAKRKIRLKQAGKCVCGRKNDTKDYFCSHCKQARKEDSDRLTTKWRIKGLCIKCGREREDFDKSKCDKCLSSEAKSKKKIARIRRDSGKCPECGSLPDHDNKLCNICLKHRREKNLRRKLKVITSYGGQCVCCKDTFLHRLTIDHINGNGAAHRKSLKYRGTGFYSWLIKEQFPEGFQVLCFSCNSCKYINKGHCPHEGYKI